jgi:hypothetical protein
MRALQSAAPGLGMQLHVMQASTDIDLNTIFATMRADALLIGPYLFFNSRMEQLGSLSLQHAVPTIFAYPSRRAHNALQIGHDRSCGTSSQRLRSSWTSYS